MRAGMHDQPAIYPVLPSRHPDREAWDLMVKPSEGTIWQTCWEYVLSHTLTDAEGAAFWTGANLIAKELAAREAAARAEALREAAEGLYRGEGPDMFEDSDIVYGEWLGNRADSIARTDGAGS